MQQVQGSESILEIIGGRAIAHKQTNGNGGGGFHIGLAAPDEFRGTRQKTGADKLIGGEQPQGVTHENGRAAAGAFFSFEARRRRRKKQRLSGPGRLRFYHRRWGTRASHKYHGRHFQGSQLTPSTGA